MKRFLIIKTSSLGDIIQTFPVLEYLKTKFPEAQIDWAVEKPFAELVEAHPLVSNVLKVDTKTWRKALFNRQSLKEIRSFRSLLRQWEYDAVFDLQGNMKSGLVTFQSKSKAKIGFGKSSISEWPNMLTTNKRFDPPKEQNVRDEYLFLVKSYFNDSTVFVPVQRPLEIFNEEVDKLTEASSKRPFVMVCPGSAWSNKQMNFDALKIFLVELQSYLNCSFFFIWGSFEEQKLAHSLHACFSESSMVVDRQPLPVLQNLMGRMDLIVAMDSLPLHLAGTTQAFTFSIFGASSSQKYKPAGEKHLSFQGECPYGRRFERRCPILRTCPTGACIRNLSGETVFLAFKQQWENRETSNI